VSTMDAPLAVPVAENATTRYLALDPSLSCGFAIIQLNAASQILSVDVGVLEVDKAITSDGPRCVNLQEQLRPLLTPPPDHAFIEPFFGHGRQGDAISFKLRAAIEIELAVHQVELTEVVPQTWKKEVSGNGKADKAAVKAALEKTLGIAFPSHLFIRGRWLKFRDDASDATGIGFWGVIQRGPLAFASSLRVSAPGLPKPRSGKSLNVAAPTPDASASAPASAPASASASASASTSTSTSTSASASTVVSTPIASLPKAVSGICGDNGCPLPRWHSGLCQPVISSPRSMPRDFRAESGRAAKRPRAGS